MIDFMGWVLFGIFLLAGFACGWLLVAAIGQLFMDWRRWMVWLALLATFSIAAAVCLTIPVAFSATPWIHIQYHETPTHARQMVALLISFPFAIAIFGLYGLRRSKADQVVRASRWSLARAALQWLMVSFVFVLAVVIQDRELCWHLRSLENEAREMTASLAPPPVDDANAAHYYQANIREYLDGSVNWNWDRLQSVGWRDAPTEEIAAILKPRAEAFERLREAARIDACRFDDKYVPIEGLLDRPLSHLQIDVHLLGHHIVNRIRQGQFDEALADVGVFRALASHLASDPRASDTGFARSLEHTVVEVVEFAASHAREADRLKLRKLIDEDLNPYPITLNAIRRHEADSKRFLARAYFGDATLYQQANLPIRRPTTWLARFIGARDDIRALELAFPTLYAVHRAKQTGTTEQQSTELPRAFIAAAPILTAQLQLMQSNYIIYERQLANLTAAAAIYRCERGTSPDVVADLIPDYLPAKGIDYSNVWLRKWREGLIIACGEDTAMHERMANSEGRTYEEAVHNQMNLLRWTTFLWDAYDEFRVREIDAR